MQADAFPRTSGARNPIVIVKIFFSCQKWCCRLNLARQGGAIWRVGQDTCTYLRHKKLHTSACRGRHILDQHVLPITPTPYVTHSKSPDTLSGGESLCYGHAHFCLESFFCKITKTGKHTFSDSSLGFCPICMKLAMDTLQLDLI